MLLLVGTACYDCWVFVKQNTTGTSKLKHHLIGIAKHHSSCSPYGTPKTKTTTVWVLLIPTVTMDFMKVNNGPPVN